MTLMTTSFRGLYDLRAGKPEDHAFVFATFLRGLYHGESWFSEIPRDIFMVNYKRILEHMLKTGNLYVACLKDDPDVIIGYSLWNADNTTLHWVYVKNTKLPDGTSWRQKGVARSLVGINPTQVSHLTAIGKKLLPKINAIFNPFSV